MFQRSWLSSTKKAALVLCAWYRIKRNGTKWTHARTKRNSTEWRCARFLFGYWLNRRNQRGNYFLMHTQILAAGLDYTKLCDGSGCQRAQICSLNMLHVSHPYLVSLSIPICLFSRIFNLLVSTHFYILLLTYISGKGGQAPYKIK